jgi:DNA-binding CsgD family transcriptional regulator
MTQSDIRLACLIRLGMTSVEISKIQNISNQGVSMARYRLRKRMGLGPDDSIPDKLNEFGS